MLAILLREPFCYMTPALYRRLSDRVIIDSYLAPRDKKGKLIPYRKRNPDPSGKATGDPDLAGRELPSMEELEVPQEALFMGPPQDYCLMFWQVWRSRTNEATGQKFTSPEVMGKYRRHVLGEKNA